MDYIALIIFLLSSILLIGCAIAFFKAKDIFSMAHIVMIGNCYAINLLLIGLTIKEFSLISLAKISIIIIFNIIISNLLCHIILRRAKVNNIVADAHEIN